MRRFTRIRGARPRTIDREAYIQARARGLDRALAAARAGSNATTIPNLLRAAQRLESDPEVRARLPEQTGEES